MRASNKVRRITTAGIVCWTSLLFGGLAYGQLNTVSAHVEIKKKADPKPQEGVVSPADLSDVVLWLKPLDRTASEVALTQQSRKKLQLTQKNKSFQPHVLVVPVGSAVDFPNHDPFFHNVANDLISGFMKREHPTPFDSIAWESAFCFVTFTQR